MKQILLHFNDTCTDNNDVTNASTNNNGNNTTTSTAEIESLSSLDNITVNVVQDIIERYIQDEKPDIIQIKQIKLWKFTFVNDTNVEVHTGSSTSTVKTSFVPTSFICGTLTWSNDYVSILFSIECYWNDNDTNDNSSKKSRTEPTTMTQSSMYFSCTMNDIQFHEEPAAKSSNIDNNSKNNKQERKIHTKMIHRFQNDDYIKSLLNKIKKYKTSIATTEESTNDINENSNSDSNNENTIRNSLSDSVLLCEARVSHDTNTCSSSSSSSKTKDGINNTANNNNTSMKDAEKTIERMLQGLSSKGIDEERVYCNDTIAQCIQRLLLFNTSSSISSSVSSSVSITSPNHANDTTNDNNSSDTSSTIDIYTIVCNYCFLLQGPIRYVPIITNRLILRILEDALYDACEKELDDTIVDSLEIENENNNNQQEQEAEEQHVQSNNNSNNSTQNHVSKKKRRG